MALPELTVMQQTFELLHQLDPQARRRVLKWVKAALDEADPAPVPAAIEHLDAEAPQATEPDDTSVVDEPASADIAGEPASAVESGAPADDRDEPTTPAASSPAPAADPLARRAAKPVRGRAKTKTATPAAEASPVAGGRGRPPADEIMQVYRQVDGKLTELAKHYGKPYGTIQGWASTLREQGYPIGRSRKS